jgi:alpha-L-rhamnosidase
MGLLLRNHAIWTSRTDVDRQQYVAFRKTFTLNSIPASARLHIFADARYLLWINGTYVSRGPCRFNPARPEYDTLDIARYLHPGNNLIAILVHYYGDCINGRIMKAQPMLSACLRTGGPENLTLLTDASWRYSDATPYLPSPESWNTIPTRIDGRIACHDWTVPSFSDSSWHFARPTTINRLGTFMPNLMPLPRETNLTNLHRLPDHRPLNSLLPLTLKQGDELIVDYGKMSMAYVSLLLNAERNSILSLHYALRYRNGNTFEEFGSGDRYIARQGMQQFMTTDQYGARYLILRCDSGSAVLHRLTVTERLFPFQHLGSFTSNDSLLNQLWNMAVNTIQTTSDDAYGSDARERNEWIQDGIKASFPCSQVALARPDGSGKSEMRLLKNIIRHAALSQLPDGRLRATFPTDRDASDCHYFIDDYACQWFGALRTYMDFTDDLPFLREMMPHLQRQIEWFERQRQSNGLYRLREYTSFDNPLAYITCQGATANAFYYKALVDASALAERLKDMRLARRYQQISRQLYTNFNRILWNNQAKAYAAAILQDTLAEPSVHAQLIALQSGIVPAERISDARRWLLHNYRNPSMTHCCSNPDAAHMLHTHCGIGMPIVYNWLFRELYRINTPQADCEALSEMRRRWTPMVTGLQDAGTLAESFLTTPDDHPSQSCHNYGVIPAYFLSSYVLGVRQEKPLSSRQLLIEPHLGDLHSASGTVVTPLGPVNVSWQITSPDTLRFRISLPAHISAILHLPGSRIQKIQGTYSGYTILSHPKIIARNEDIR